MMARLSAGKRIDLLGTTSISPPLHLQPHHSHQDKHQGNLLVHHSIIDCLSSAALQQNAFTLREDYQAIDRAYCGDREII